MTLFQSVVDAPCGSRHSLLVKSQHFDDFIWGEEVPTGHAVFFRIEGDLETEFVTLYDVLRGPQTSNGSIRLMLDEQSTWYPSNHPQIRDLGFAHDVCSGIGGFHTAFSFLGGHTISSVDFSTLACSAYRRVFGLGNCADISCSKTVRALHAAQYSHSCQAILLAGFPCQPLSRQGSQLRSEDSRSSTLPAILRAAALLRSACVVLECVTEALTDPSTQAYIREFCDAFGYSLDQACLHLHTVWPSKRSRWFAVCVAEALNPSPFSALPELNPWPAIRDVIVHWPEWTLEEEAQLQWTALEKQVYSDPQYGNPQRHVCLSDSLPTALRSWGSALYACPCGCRPAGLSAKRLKASGLRGVAIVSKVTGLDRHIHPKELQLLLGFPPIQPCGSDCKASLCLFGNAVSPIQAIWVLGHLLYHNGFEHCEPSRILRQYLQDLIVQRDLVWPPSVSGRGVLTLVTNGVATSVNFGFGAKIAQLLTAESVLKQEAVEHRVLCEGYLISAEAYLQERTYVIASFPSGLPCQPLGFLPVPCTIWFLGVQRRLIVAAGMTLAQVVRWCKIPQWLRIVTPEGHCLQDSSIVYPGQHFVVQIDAADIGFDLMLREQDATGLSEVGFGFDGLLKISSPWTGLGLGHLDELATNHLLASWSGSQFAPLAVWLPSFSAAIIEVWPHSVEESLKAWLHSGRQRIFVIFHDDIGWNILSVEVDRLSTTIHFFDDSRSATAGHLAYRIMRASDRACYREVFHSDVCLPDRIGSFARALSIIDSFVGVPLTLQHALFRIREKYGATSAFGRHCQISATLPMHASENQLPLPIVDRDDDNVVGGLSTTFVLDFARALAAQYPTTISSQQIRVLICDGSNQPDCIAFKGGPDPLFLFVLCDCHWTLLHCTLTATAVHVLQYDGLHATPIAKLEGIVSVLKHDWQVQSHVVESTWQVSQTRKDSCGTIALGHFAWCLGVISVEDIIGFEAIHPCLVLCSEAFSPKFSLRGFGNEQQVLQALSPLLQEKGVAADQVGSRIQAAIKVFGSDALAKCLASKNPWSALKTLGNSKPRQFKWVTNEELQVHIQDRATSKFGVDGDIKRTKKQRDVRKPAPSAENIDTSTLVLPAGIFVTITGQSVSQISLTAMQKEASGIAFAHVSEIGHFLQDGKMISTEALGLLVVGKIPDQFSTALPMQSTRVPAIYKGTNEPVLLDCVSIQLGDQAIYRKPNAAAPTFAVFPTCVFRVHVFRDLWEAEYDWDSLVSKPVRSLVSTFGQFRLCRDVNCAGTCELYHPSIEEDGIESGLIDVWGFNWHKLDGVKVPPGKAEVWSVYVRVPESSFNTLHIASGHCGVFFEPRLPDGPGVDASYAVVWVPQHTLSDIQHRVKTNDFALAACRLGSKYGIRCLAKNQEELHKSLNLKKPFVGCTVKQIYRLEPLPAGTQRQSLADICKTIGWTAKPLQPCKGSQGRAWEIGSEQVPPQQFIEAQHGWVTITKLRDVAPPAKKNDLVATSKTMQHIRDGTPAQATSSGSTDPWFNGADPWGNYQGVSTPKPPAPPSQRVQQKFDDVEQRLQDSVKASVEQIASKFNSEDRIAAVESQVQALMTGQSTLEAWARDNSVHISELKSNQESVQSVVTQCATTIQSQGATLGQVVQDVAQCSASLQDQGSALAHVAKEVGGSKESLGTQLSSYFEQQSAKLEALLGKKQRTA